MVIFVTSCYKNLGDGVGWEGVIALLLCNREFFLKFISYNYLKVELKT